MAREHLAVSFESPCVAKELMEAEEELATGERTVMFERSFARERQEPAS